MAQYKDRTGQVWAYDRREGGYQRVVDGKPDDGTTIQSLDVLEHAWGPLEPVEDTSMTDEQFEHMADDLLKEPAVSLDDKRDRLKALNTAISTSIENLARMGFQMEDSAFFAVRLEALVERTFGALDGDDATEARVDFELDFATTVHQMMRNTLTEAQSRKTRDTLLRPDGNPFRR